MAPQTLASRNNINVRAGLHVYSRANELCRKFTASPKAWRAAKQGDEYESW